MSPEEARRAARRQFGNQTWLKEVSREMWSLRFIEALIQDLRYGARMLMKNPGFTLLAVLTLALGIGSTTAIFSAIQNILLDPFPYKDAHRVVTIRIHDTSSSRPGGRRLVPGAGIPRLPGAEPRVRRSHRGHRRRRAL